METAQKSLTIPQRSSQLSARQTGERQTDFGVGELYAFHNRARFRASGGSVPGPPDPAARPRIPVSVRALAPPRTAFTARPLRRAPPPRRRPLTAIPHFPFAPRNSRKRDARHAAPGARLSARSRGFRPATGPAYGERMGSRRAGRRSTPERKCAVPGFRTHRRQKNPKLKLPRVCIRGRRLGVRARRTPHREGRNPPRGRPPPRRHSPASPAPPGGLPKNGAMLPS